MLGPVEQVETGYRQSVVCDCSWGPSFRASSRERVHEMARRGIRRHEGGDSAAQVRQGRPVATNMPAFLGCLVALAAGAAIFWLGWKLVIWAIPNDSADTTSQRYEHVLDLRDAAVDAGYECPSWFETDTVPGSSSSGVCSDFDLFAVFDSNSDPGIELVIEAQREGDTATLRGSNWVIVCPDPEALQAELGGEVIQ